MESSNYTMLGVTGPMMGSPGDGAAETHDSGGGSSEIGGPSSAPGGGGNRWPREETLALIRIRSEMDVVFRDSSLKGPLWEEVSRKMASLGFHRTSKKCKEKFENVYKYHKRTKDGRAAKSDGKTYRFFDQLAALENAPPPRAAAPANSPMPSHATVSSISPTPLSVIHPQSANPVNSQPRSDSTSSSSTSSDEDIQRRRRRGKKRKWKDYFERLMKEAVEKQEALQKKFLENLENQERDRTAREEARRVQETARINQEHEVLARERSMAAAKDAALIAFLQKVNDQNNLQIPIATNPPPQQFNFPAKAPGPPDSTENGSSRWPKAEVQALINLRTGMDLKYQENTAAKGPLWEEIAAAMAAMGYRRSAKRCKEKWENINKYYKKVKESSNRRSRDSNICPYFHQLEAIYKERAKNDAVSGLPNNPIQAQPEQQWPVSADKRQPQDSGMDGQDVGNDESDELDDEDEGGAYDLIADKETSIVDLSTS